eukprot:COSAG01_NODE_32921_length_573_cov_0.856540_1_plen_26_part_10
MRWGGSRVATCAEPSRTTAAPGVGIV